MRSIAFAHRPGRGLTDEWLTPPDLMAKLGEFDLDPCSPISRPWPTAKTHYTQADDGLAKRWEGRVWLNPPYSRIEWAMNRMAVHGHGMALVFARTETRWFFASVWSAASAILFLRGRLHFHHANGERARGNAGGPHVLIAYGLPDAMYLSGLAELGAFQWLSGARKAVASRPPTNPNAARRGRKHDTTTA